jgi:hypothetical protein
MEEMNENTKKSNSTAVVMLNTRNIRGYQSLKEMQKPESKGLWGNQISFLQISIPKLSQANPLEFVWESCKHLQKKKRSFSVHLIGLLMDLEMKLRGPEVCNILIFNHSPKNLILHVFNYIHELIVLKTKTLLYM